MSFKSWLAYVKSCLIHFYKNVVTQTVIAFFSNFTVAVIQFAEEHKTAVSDQN